MSAPSAQLRLFLLRAAANDAARSHFDLVTPGYVDDQLGACDARSAFAVQSHALFDALRGLDGQLDAQTTSAAMAVSADCADGSQDG